MEGSSGLKLTPLSQWKKVETTLDCELEPGFGGLEVLEHYDCQIIKPQAHSGSWTVTKKSVSVKDKSKKRKSSATDGLVKKKNKRTTETEEANPRKKDIKGADKMDGDSSGINSDSKLASEMEGWKNLFVPQPVLQSLHELGFTSPTLIQALTLPAAIRNRQDILGAAETGSGKTLAFGIPVIDKIMKLKIQRADESEQTGAGGVYALILTPTRELCVQVKDHLSKAAKYTDISVVAIFGGLSTQKQVRLLKARPEIVVATPGRLWDIMNSEEDAGSFLYTVVQAPLLVIDEADKMIEKGHFEELTKVLTLMKSDEESSRKRQCFVFSATLTYVHLPPDRLHKGGKKKKKRSKKVEISKESKLDELIETVGILKRPKVIDVTEKSHTASGLVESCIFCAQNEKDLYLYYFLHRHPGRTLIFSNSIDCIRRLVCVFSLMKKTLLPLHASMHQKQRLKNLEKFTASPDGILLATDVAARGLDIPNVQHVIHYQVPRTAESYVHRSGRTARALKDGLSVIFVDEKDIQNYKKILKSLDKVDTLSTFPVVQAELRSMKSTVSLAQRIDTTRHRSEKVKRRVDWFAKMAKEADLELSDDEGSDEGQDEQMRQKVKDRRKLDAMKGELSLLLEGGEVKGQSYRGKYPTVSGKLELPKSMTVKTGAKAITLVSRRRR